MSQANNCPVCGFHVNVQRDNGMRKGLELYHPYCHKVREEMAALRAVLHSVQAMLEAGSITGFHEKWFCVEPEYAKALRTAVQEAQAQAVGGGGKGEAT